MSGDPRSPASQAEGVALLCERLATLGVEFAAISPGSRSAPITLALNESGRIRCLPVIDERSAGFVALGAAKTSRRPALVVTTSGTAAANLAPAIHEAREARVPLIALTADRPPELRGIGEGQTIDQVRLFGTAAAYLELDEWDAGGEWVELAGNAFAAATGQRPGPVQVNLSMRPPLDSVAPPAAPSAAPSASAAAPEPIETIRATASLLAAGERPVAIAGRDEGGSGGVIAAEMARLGVPLLADPLSGAGSGTTAVPYWDAILRSEEWRRAHLPDLVIRTGDMPTSKPLRCWLGEARSGGAKVVQFDPEAAHRDPTRSTTHLFADSPTAVLPALDPPGRGEAWNTAWTSAAGVAADALAPLTGGLGEPGLASALYRSLPPESLLFVSASMPIRDFEGFVTVDGSGPKLLSNRGANGIDGVVSTAAGAALASGRRTSLLIGDVAFCHDQGALMLLRDARPDLSVVVVDNGGGAIFDYLPVAARADSTFERFFTTPTRLPLRGLCEAWGLPYLRLGSLADLERAASGSDEGPLVLHARIARDSGPRLRAEAWEAVASRLAELDRG